MWRKAIPQNREEENHREYIWLPIYRTVVNNNWLHARMHTPIHKQTSTQAVKLALHQHVSYRRHQGEQTVLVCMSITRCNLWTGICDNDDDENVAYTLVTCETASHSLLLGAAPVQHLRTREVTWIYNFASRIYQDLLVLIDFLLLLLAGGDRGECSPFPSPPPPFQSVLCPQWDWMTSAECKHADRDVLPKYTCYMKLYCL